MTDPSADQGAEATSGDLFPPEIERVTADVATVIRDLQKRWPHRVDLSIATQASIYHSYPFLFLGAFPALPGDRIATLCVAASLFADSLFVADDLMDEDPTDRDTTTNVLRIQAMQHEGYRMLHSLFAPQTRFWDRFRDYMALYARACMDERHFMSAGVDWKELTQQLALRIAKGKSSLAKFVVAGLAELAGDEAPVDPLTRAVDRYYVARQMVDDLSDWRQDLARGCPSLLLARVAADEAALAGPGELRSQPDLVGRVIYLRGHARYTIALALQALAEADALTAGFPDLLWHRIAGRLRERCRSLRRELEHIAAEAEEQLPEGRQESAAARRCELRLPAAEGPWQETAWQALRFLVRGGQARRRRAAAGGDVLGRALVADALCDAGELLDGQLQPLLAAEAEFLLRHRLSAGRGGWGWSEVSPGLPADTEHLGCVLRVLLRSGARAAAAEHCEPALASLLLHDLPPLWIGGPADRPPGGDSLDETAMAHLLTALDLYDGARFRDLIGRGLSWLAARQHADGSWTSLGSRGPFLATSACVDAFAALRPGASALERAAELLRRSQHADGGWGTDAARSSAVCTALALRSLARLQPQAGCGDAERAERGRARLLSLARFDAPDPANTAAGRLTAAFALQAALGWQRTEHRQPAAALAAARPGKTAEVAP